MDKAKIDTMREEMTMFTGQAAEAAQRDADAGKEPQRRTGILAKTNEDGAVAEACFRSHAFLGTSHSTQRTTYMI